MMYLNRDHHAALLVYLLLAAACFVFAACSDASPPSEDTCPDGTVRAETGECVEPEPECTEGSCERGVCVLGEGCVNADDCAGDASRCIEGFFCADDDSCQPDLCEQNEVECPRGVCDRTSGECVEPETCDASSDCLSGKRCLSGECTDEAVLCGEQGCEGGLVCDFDEESQSAECVEPTQCETSGECSEGRVCAGEQCTSAPVCEPERFEPNDSAGEATAFASAARNHAVDATLCAADTDHYLIDVPSNEESTTSRVLRVVVEFSRREVGLGPITATIYDPDGEEAASQTSGDDATIDIDHPLPINAEGAYRITVEYASDDARGGIHYRLAAKVEPRAMDEACAAASQITVDEPIEDSTGRPQTALLRSRCSGDDSLLTNLHAFEVEEASEVTVRLTTDNPEGFVVGVRSDCRRIDTEQACKAGRQTRFGSANDLIELDAGVLAPGSYFVLVQNAELSSAGTYELEVSTTTPGCNPADNSCTDLSKARTCSAENGSWSTEQCERGCEPHTGTCRPLPAETCDSAPVIDRSTTVEIDWDDFTDDYRVPEQACLPVIGGTTQTDGPDAVYQVDVPPRHTFRAALRAEDARFASLYLLEDCLDPAQRCVEGANEDYVDAEQFTYWNESDNLETLFLVADTAEQFRGTAELEVNLDPIVCGSQEKRCHEGVAQHCDEQRTGWTTVEECGWGCTQGTCDVQPGKTCENPIALTTGQTFSGQFSDLDNDVSSDISSCDARLPALQRAHYGSDAFFSIALNQGDLLTAELETQPYPAVVYVFDQCEEDPSESCLWADSSSNSLQFYAPETATYFLGVDARSGTADVPFELSVDVQSGHAACQPGGTFCDTTTDELVICDDSGTRELDRRVCPNGCGRRGCSAPLMVNDTCGSPHRISGSARFVEDLSRFGDDYDGSSSCGVSTFDGQDAVYEVSLAADELLRASVQAVGDADPVVYLMSDCADLDGSCVAGDSGLAGAAELSYHASAPETLYLVVDRQSDSSDGEVVIDVDIRPVVCQNGQTQCAGVPGALDYCNELGVWEPYSCAGSCTAGACDTPTGGICQDAIPVSAGQRVTGDFGGTNDVELGGQTGACTFSGADNTTGPDTFYRIDLQQGDLLEVDLLTVHDYASVHILEDCTGLDTCQPGTSYRAESDGPVFVMVDDSRAPTGSANAPTFELTFNVTPGATCTPSTWSCLNNTTVARCNDDGDGYEATYVCPQDCARGGCEPAASLADQCTSAPDIGDGTVVYADPGELTDSVSFDPLSSLPDLVYEISVSADDVLYAEATNASIRLMEDCADPQGSELEPSATADLPSDVHGVYLAPDQARTVKVVAEIDSPAQPVRLQIERFPSQCSEGARSCSPSGDATRLCEPYGVWRETPCKTSCSNGRCDVPSGDICEDAIQLGAGQLSGGQLSAGMSVAGDFRDFDTDISVWSYNDQCDNFSDNPDAVYEIDLAQGDMLRAKLIGPSRSSLSLLDGCVQPVEETCIMSNHVDVMNNEADRNLDFVAPDAGTYFLVVDQGPYGSERGSEFVLEVDVEPGKVCQPNTWSCDESAQLAQRCNDDGTAYARSYACPHGCDGEVCARSPAANETCSSAIEVDASTIFYDSFDNYTNDYPQLPQCTSQYVNGPESVYAITLAEDELLRVEFAPASNSSFNLRPALFLTDSCSGQPGACLAQSIDNYDRGELTYQAQSAGTVYLVVDNSSFSDNSYRLEIDIAQPECTSATARCADSDTLEHCEDGLVEQRTCAFGCANASCLPASNDVCGGATAIARDGEFHTHRLDFDEDYTDQVNLGATNNACSSWNTDGPDAIYRVDAQVGDVLTAYWPPAFGRMLWLTEDCANASRECIVESASGYLERTFAAAGTYWLIVDTEAAFSSDPVEFDVRLEPQNCQPGQASCDATTGMISYCNAKGTAYKDYACQGGCDDTTSPPTCTRPRGEQCVDAIDATQGGRFAINLNRYDDTFAPDDFACLPSEPDGGDVIYRVDLAAGETVEATAHTPRDQSAAVYILDSCHTADPVSACLTGDFPSSGQPATASYTATSAETVWVVVDSSNSLAALDTWTVDIAVQ